MYEVAASPDRVTSSDVARAAGVSRTTVSYVFNGRGAIPEETRTRVRAVADSLGYRPSGIARALRTGTTDLVVLVLPAWSPSDVLGRLIRRMSMGLEALGLPMVVTQVEPESVGLWAAMTPLGILSLPAERECRRPGDGFGGPAPDHERHRRTRGGALRRGLWASPRATSDEPSRGCGPHPVWLCDAR